MKLFIFSLLTLLHLLNAYGASECYNHSKEFKNNPFEGYVEKSDSYTYSFISPQNDNKGVLGYLKTAYPREDGSVKISDIFIDKIAQGNGIQKILMNELLKDRPEFHSFHLEFGRDNKDQFLIQLMNLLGYENSPSKNLNAYFNSNYLEIFFSLSKEEQEKFITHAVNFIPTVKSFKKIEGLHLCSQSFSKVPLSSSSFERAKLGQLKATILEVTFCRH